MDNVAPEEETGAMTKDADALIVGGGLNGPATALALAGAGLRVALIDAAEPDLRMDPGFDGRAYNLGLASRRFLQVIVACLLNDSH